MTVQELIDKLQEIEDRSLPVCVIEKEEYRYSELTADIIRTPEELMSVTFRKGCKGKYNKGFERKDRIELEEY